MYNTTLLTQNKLLQLAANKELMAAFRACCIRRLSLKYWIRFGRIGLWIGLGLWMKWTDRRMREDSWSMS